ncbi:MAG TPA: GDSL-type esterase/lipase family protein [Ktedonobacteraceae bacterium]
MKRTDNNQSGTRAMTTKTASDTRKMIVACFGASITAAKGSFNWIGELEKRPQNQRFRFLNFGVGGDLAYSALQRLGSVVAYHPDLVIIVLGHNDIVTLVFENVRRIFGRWKHLPGDPSPAWYRENLQTIVRRLKEETSARIALASLSQIGEDPESNNPVQRELNQRFQQYNEIIKDIAREENVSYIPFYERFHEHVVALPGRAFTAFRFPSFYRDAFRLLVLRRSLDEIAQKNGWRFHTDGLHLNSRGGMILADLVQEFLDSELKQGTK